MLLALPKFDQTYVIFPNLFQVWSKILSPISNQAMALHFQNMMRAATQVNAFGLCNTQSVLIKGSSKAYSLYKV